LLEVNLKLSQMIDLNRNGLQVAMDEEVLKISVEMEQRMSAMFDQYRRFVGFATTKLNEKITPYDTNDMRKVLGSQKETLHDVLAKNALLVTENSELRVHLSFVPAQWSIATTSAASKVQTTSTIAISVVTRRLSSRTPVTSITSLQYDS
jgi:hypothetical protein